MKRCPNCSSPSCNIKPLKGCITRDGFSYIPFACSICSLIMMTEDIKV